ncbi:MAG: urate hydroxylase PuuD [Pseudomonadota bacterium]|nr:urate hydroxylase PuuD [Pseudomonadota bacterium]
MEFSYDFWVFIVRWLHVLSGVMWIGLLWYFNFVQTPTVPKIPEELRPAIPKHIMPVALFWFRWAAVSTLVWGLILAHMNGYLGTSLAIGLTDQVAKHASIGFGMWMGIIMAFNVWFIIWPNQQKVIGLVEASDEEKPKAARSAALASRVNTMLSIPMLYSMVSAQNLY